MICKDHSKTNNKFLKSYNPSKLLTHIMYLGANNLHGHPILQPLPAEILDWINPKTLI